MADPKDLQKLSEDQLAEYDMMLQTFGQKDADDYVNLQLLMIAPPAPEPPPQPPADVPPAQIPQPLIPDTITQEQVPVTPTGVPVITPEGAPGGRQPRVIQPKTESRMFPRFTTPLPVEEAVALQEQKYAPPTQFELDVMQSELYREALANAVFQGYLQEASTTDLYGQRIVGLREEAEAAYESRSASAPEMTLEDFTKRYIEFKTGGTPTAEEIAFKMVYEGPRVPRAGGFEREKPIVEPSRVDIARRPEAAKELGTLELAFEALRPQIITPGSDIREARAQAAALRTNIEQSIDEANAAGGSVYANTKDIFKTMRDARVDELYNQVLSRIQMKDPGRNYVTPEESAAIENTATGMVRSVLKETGKNPRYKEITDQLLSDPDFGAGVAEVERAEYYDTLSQLMQDVFTVSPEERIEGLITDNAIQTRIRNELVELGVIRDPDAITESTLATLVRDIGVLQRLGVSAVFEAIDSLKSDEDKPYLPVPVGPSAGIALPFLLLTSGRVSPEEEIYPFDMTKIDPETGKVEQAFGRRSSPADDLSFYENLMVEVASGRTLGNDVVALERLQPLVKEGVPAFQFPRVERLIGVKIPEIGRQYPVVESLLGVERLTGFQIPEIGGLTPEYVQLGLFGLGTVSEMFIPLDGPIGIIRDAGGALRALGKDLKVSSQVLSEEAARVSGLPILPATAALEGIGEVGARVGKGLEEAGELVENPITYFSRKGVKSDFKKAQTVLEEAMETSGAPPTSISKLMDDNQLTINAKKTADYRGAFSDFVAETANVLNNFAKGSRMYPSNTFSPRTRTLIQILFEDPNSAQKAQSIITDLRKNKYFDLAFSEIERLPAQARDSEKLSAASNIVKEEMISGGLRGDFVLLTPKVVVSTRWLDDNIPNIKQLQEEFQSLLKYDSITASYKVDDPLAFSEFISNNKLISVNSSDRTLSPRQLNIVIEEISENYALSNRGVKLTGREGTEKLAAQAAIPPSRRAIQGLKFASEYAKDVSKRLFKSKRKQKVLRDVPARAKVKVRQFDDDVKSFEGSLERTMKETIKKIARTDKNPDEVFAFFTRYAVVSRGNMSDLVAMSDDQIKQLRDVTKMSFRDMTDSGFEQLKETYYQIISAYFGSNISKAPVEFRNAWSDAMFNLQGSLDFSPAQIQSVIDEISVKLPGITGTEAENLDSIVLAYGIDTYRENKLGQAFERSFMEDINFIRPNAMRLDDLILDEVLELELQGLPTRGLSSKLTTRWAAHVYSGGGTADVDFTNWLRTQPEFAKTNIPEGFVLPNVKPGGEELSTYLFAYEWPGIPKSAVLNNVQNLLVAAEKSIVPVPPGVSTSELGKALKSESYTVNLKNTLEAAAATYSFSLSTLNDAIKGSWVQGQLSGKYWHNFGYQVNNTVSQPIMTFITSPEYTLTVAGQSLKPACQRFQVRVAAQAAPDSPSAARGYNNRQLYELISQADLGSTSNNVYMSFSTGFYNDARAAAAGLDPLVEGVFEKQMLQKAIDQLVPFAGMRVEAATGFAGTRQSPASQFAVEVDYSVREGVFIAALNDGLSPGTAARLAREAQFDYGTMPEWFKSTIGAGALYTTFTYVTLQEIVMAAGRPGGAVRISRLAAAHQAVSNALNEYKGVDDTPLKTLLTFRSPFAENDTVFKYWGDPYMGAIETLGGFALRTAAGIDDPYNPVDYPIALTSASVETLYQQIINSYNPVLDVRKELDSFDYRKPIPSKLLAQVAFFEQYFPNSAMDYFDIERIPVEDVRQGRPDIMGFQYRFRSQEGYNNFVMLTLALNAAGANRMMNDITGAFIASGQLPEGSHFGYQTPEGTLAPGPLYFFVGERVVRPPPEIGKINSTLQMNKRELKQLESNLK